MEYTPLEVIGRGSFGQIRKVQREDGTILVRKEISYKAMNQKERTQLIAEFRILKALDHPNIVKYLHHEHVPETHEVHLYMEYCDGGDLASFIRELQQEQAHLPEREIWLVFTQLVLALYRCHYNTVAPASTETGELPSTIPQSFVLHRDIKPENVFISDSVIKLGDFGLAKLLDRENPLANTYVGTPYYMSPEVLADQPSTPASDIWSLGCVMYELCALQPPFRAKSHLQLSQRIREGKFAPIPDIYSSTLSKLINALLTVTPSSRPTCATLLKLDVIRVYRHELEVLARERALERREAQLAAEKRTFKERIEREVLAMYQDELAAAIDAEVERRMKLARATPEERVRGPRSLENRRALDELNTSWDTKY